MSSEWDVLIVAGPHDLRYRPGWARLFHPDFDELAGESEVATRVDDDAGTIEAQAVVRIRAADSAEAEAIARQACRDGGLTVALDDGQVDPPGLTVTVSPGDHPFDEALDAIYSDADQEW
jgi:hypothetical protein